jgi:hypothetical protein
MLDSFRARLLAGFAIVVALSLFLSASAFILMLREQQAEAAEQRIGVLVQPLTAETRQYEREGYPAWMIRQFMVNTAQYYDIRILLINREDTVIVDTDADEALLQQQIVLDAAQPVDREGRVSTFYTQRISTADGELYCSSPRTRWSASARPRGRRTASWSPCRRRTSRPPGPVCCRVCCSPVAARA